MTLRSLVAAGALVLAASAFVPTEAAAVVCARGVVRAGCAGPNGAVAVRRPVAVAPVNRRPVAVAPVKTCRLINGARVCRTRW
ncbi:MAG: hypothetical protein ACOYOJ_04345 [Alsobacter sp.]